MVGGLLGLHSETLFQKKKKGGGWGERNLPTFFLKTFVPALLPPTVTESSPSSNTSTVGGIRL